MNRAERFEHRAYFVGLQAANELPVEIGEIGELLLLQRRFLHPAFPEAALP